MNKLKAIILLEVAASDSTQVRGNRDKRGSWSQQGAITGFVGESKGDETKHQQTLKMKSASPVMPLSIVSAVL